MSSRWMVMLVHSWDDTKVELWGMSKKPRTGAAMGDGYIVVFNDKEAAKREYPDATLVEIANAT